MDTSNEIQIAPKVKVIKSSSFYLIAVIIAILLWSTSFVGTKIAYNSFPPLTLGAARFVIASLILGAIMLSRKEFIRPAPKDIGLMALSGILGTTLYFALENIGLELTTASSAALIVASYPAIAALMEFIFFRVKISWLKGLGIVMAIAGVYQISGGSSGGIAGNLTGNLILILAGVVFAAYNFTTRKVVKNYSMVTVSFYQTIAGTLAFLPLAWIERARWQVPSTESLWTLLYLGVFCSVAAFMLYNYGLRNLSSGTAMALMNLVPLFGVIFSTLFLHEVLHIFDLIGGMIIIVGVILSVQEKFTGGRKTKVQ
ncbi:multidrug ABC transporter permease [Paenibacillus ferrarius]|uniref:Multidrug ABC transporter permease n=1 Tax=Paenibacillus ferrarius TaxID=1469647 RepID=A0A1V4HRX4_9BACL|nr:EamA family transporter [Paenibacillus ferrarius]OPH61380.1 multidrug ABC transporter permease [Paenibacillus ferrarius]